MDGRLDSMDGSQTVMLSTLIGMLKNDEPNKPPKRNEGEDGKPVPPKSCTSEDNRNKVGEKSLNAKHNTQKMSERDIDQCMSNMADLSKILLSSDSEPSSNEDSATIKGTYTRGHRVSKRLKKRKGKAPIEDSSEVEFVGEKEYKPFMSDYRHGIDSDVRLQLLVRTLVHHVRNVNYLMFIM